MEFARNRYHYCGPTTKLVEIACLLELTSNTASRGHFDTRCVAIIISLLCIAKKFYNYEKLFQLLCNCFHLWIIH